MTFAALLVTQKYDKRKASLSLFAGERCSPLPHNLKAPSTAKTRNQIFHPLFLLHMQAQKKKLSKRKRRNKISRSAERDEDSASSTRKPLKRLDLNFNEKSDGCPPLFIIPFFRPFSLSAVLPFHRKQTVYFRPMQLPLRLFSAGLSSAFPRRGACRF